VTSRMLNGASMPCPMTRYGKAAIWRITSDSSVVAA
jgi:hypothetical protein